MTQLLRPRNKQVGFHGTFTWSKLEKFETKRVSVNMVKIPKLAYDLFHCIVIYV